jgi:hypothetical protein
LWQDNIAKDAKKCSGKHNFRRYSSFIDDFRYLLFWRIVFLVGMTPSAVATVGDATSGI